MEISKLNLEDMTWGGTPRDDGRDPAPATSGRDASAEHLCDRCGGINFDAVLFGEREPPSYEGESEDVVDLGPV